MAAAAVAVTDDDDDEDGDGNTAPAARLLGLCRACTKAFDDVCQGFFELVDAATGVAVGPRARSRHVCEHTSSPFPVLSSSIQEDKGSTLMVIYDRRRGEGGHLRHRYRWTVRRYMDH